MSCQQRRSYTALFRRDANLHTALPAMLARLRGKRGREGRLVFALLVHTGRSRVGVRSTNYIRRWP